MENLEIVKSLKRKNKELKDELEQLRENLCKVRNQEMYYYLNFNGLCKENAKLQVKINNLQQEINS